MAGPGLFTSCSRHHRLPHQSCLNKSRLQSCAPVPAGPALLDKLINIEETYINGSLDSKVPNILNISFNFVEGESLIMALDNVAVSSGSACTSASLEPSYVLRAIGRDDELAHSSIRFSFGKNTSVEEVDRVADTMVRVIEQLRELSPLWDMYLDGVDFSTVKWNTH